MWRLRVNEQLLVENDRAITRLFLEAVAEAHSNLSKEFGLPKNREGKPDSDLVVEAMLKAADGWQILLWAMEQLPPKENIREAEVTCRLLDRALDNLELAFNHLILLKRYLLGNLQSPIEECSVPMTALQRLALSRAEATIVMLLRGHYKRRGKSDLLQESLFRPLLLASRH